MTKLSAVEVQLMEAAKAALEKVGLETIRSTEFFGTNERRVILNKAA